MVDQQSSRAAVTHTHIETPGNETFGTDTTADTAAARAVTGSLYEAGFTTTGDHPQGGAALARTIHQARRRLADMLIFCDPAAAVTADIVEFTHAQTVYSYRGTVADLYAQCTIGTIGTTGTADRTVIARPLTGLPLGDR